MSITPQEAFDALRILDPRVEKIEFQKGTGFNAGDIICFHGVYITRNYGGNVEWPEGVTQWPPPEKKWRVPTDEDAMNRPPCRVRNNIDFKWDDRYVLLFVFDKNCGPKFLTVSCDGVPIYVRYCEIEELVESMSSETELF